MKDFTFSVYKSLLSALKDRGYRFQTFRQYLDDAGERVILLRHDVDDRKEHSLEFARIQYRMGLVGTYYFRVVPESFDEKVIREIADMGHEVGYHYEDMDFAGGDPHQAVRYFEKHLDKLRNIVPVTTICMHGSPRSKYDNKDVWKYYDYRDFGIVGEPYFDLDFREIFYLTDTGRRWDGYTVSVRDKVRNHFDRSFKTTPEIIGSIREGNFPEKVMLNFHPQRWTDQPALWLKEKYSQQAKNMVKYWLIKFRSG